MQLFIDANIFLSFYHYSSDELEELRKLRVLIEKGQVKLLVPEQVIDEFRRNRDGKIADALKQFAGQKLEVPFPQLAKDYQEYKGLRDLRTKFQEGHQDLMERMRADAAGQRFKADEIIEELLNAAGKLPRTPEVTQAAQLRSQLGNPPGKAGSLGDAINWETLLAAADGDDIYLVSEDKDFASGLDDAQADSFLLAEWRSKKSGKVFLFKRLSQFFGVKFPEIKLAVELEKDLLIKGLEHSSTFKETHRLISELSKLSDLSPGQANDIAYAAVTNDQVTRIIGDPDVKAFLERLIAGHDRDIDREALAALQNELRQAEATKVDAEQP